MRKDPDQLTALRLQHMKSHKCVVTDEDYKQIIPKIELLKRLSGIEQSIYTVYDMNKQNYLLKSDEQKKTFGFKDGGDYENEHAEIIYKNIHPDDLPFVLETVSMIYYFFSELPADEKMDYKLVYDFRVKNNEGIYMRYMHQTIVLEQDKTGKTWLWLIITDLLSEKPSNEKPQRRLINVKTGKLHLFNNDDDSNSEVLLTKRETEILSLIARGYDSKNISDKLFISINTVNNHRQNILRKTRTDNTTQALLFAKRLGII